MEEKPDLKIEELKRHRAALQDGAVAQSRKMLWVWGVIAVASMVTLVGKVLDFTTDEPVARRVFLPGLLFIVSAVGVTLNRRVVARAGKDKESGAGADEPQPEVTGESEGE